MQRLPSRDDHEMLRAATSPTIHLSYVPPDSEHLQLDCRSACRTVGIGRRIRVVEVRLLYLEGCPNWHKARTRLRRSLDRLGRSDLAVSAVRVDSADEALAARFAG